MIRRIVKLVALGILGTERKNRTLLRGLPAGYKMCISPREHLGYIVGTIEPHFQRAVRRYVRPGQTAYDIGANIGYMALSLARAVGANGKVFAFEPVPGTFASLQQNIAVNGISNVTAFPYAVSDVPGEVQLRIDGDAYAMASLVWHAAAESHSVAAPSVTIDDLVSAGKISPPHFVKIDVEGAEGMAVSGMMDTLRRFRPVVFLECSDSGRARTWEALSQLGYACFAAVTLKRTLKFEGYRHADFVWVPE